MLLNYLYPGPQSKDAVASIMSVYRRFYFLFFLATILLLPKANVQTLDYYSYLSLE